MREIRSLPAIVRVTDEAAYQPYQAKGFLFSSEQTSVPASGVRDERLADVGDTTAYTYRLFGVLPLKTVSVVQSDEVYVTPGGASIGIAIRTQGVLVVGLSSVETSSGPQSPGSAAGLQAGDVIVSADGAQISDAAHLSSLCKKADGALSLVIDRSGARMTLSARPVSGLDGQKRLGIWARDSTAGVGTLSFCDEESGWFAALGHPVSDVDTHALLSVREGKIVASEVVDVIRGEQGAPGELLGVFSLSGQQLGQIVENTDFGIYGKTLGHYENPASEPVPMAMPFEAHTGPATLLTTVSGEGVQTFSCEIVRVSPQSSPAPKGMVVSVSDAALLQKTGGIVQGMSGSPILQDGKLIGVVTHVFVNDPTKGYCIYAEWMRDGIRKARDSG